MDWQQASEVVVGKVLLGELSSRILDDERLFEPYSDIAKQLKLGDDETMLTDRFGPAPIIAARQAAQAVASIRADYTAILAVAYHRYQVGMEFEKVGRKMQGGDDVDYDELLSMTRRVEHRPVQVVLASSVKPETEHFKLIFWRPLDDHIGGVARSGMTIIAALPKQGKTSLLALLAILAADKGKMSLIFSLEQRKEEFVGRLKELGATAKALKYILICDDRVTIDQAATIAARAAEDHDLYFVGADFTDLLIHQQIDESATTRVYQVGAELAKELALPFFLLAQFNDQAYKSGIPRVEHIRYSRMAVAFASSILLLYNPFGIWAGADEDKRLPLFPGDAYVIAAVSRHGFGEHSGMGAMRVEWKPKSGWGRSARAWHPLNGGNI